MNNEYMKVGDNVLVSIPPGWLIVGKVSEVNETFVTLSPAAWIEGTETNMAVFQLAIQAKKVVTSSHQIPLIKIAHSYIGMVIPILPESVGLLVNKTQVEAVKNS